MKSVNFGLMEKNGSSGVLKGGKNGHFNTSDGIFWEFQPILRDQFGSHPSGADS